ncbi:hypothetical protein JTE90_022804 [Oedothorax gibbosus]|uniref:Lipase domain-containing protein n=1 Tax=Oedothorax gibbosus TaxID=931172 RepID=A0AAV6V6G7_9ARAC|nr:hypothetical protein JTE90_022804 [Oedothorax gibbosus]
MFHLYTRKNRNNPFTFSPEKVQTVLQSEFNPNVWTRIISHGFTDGPYISNWQLSLKDDLLRFSDDNVIILDHSTTLLPPRLLYQQSVADTRLIGAQAANVIKFLVKKCGANLKRFHIIGHSLGAIIAGYAGERLNKLGRITGLDPAGPYFRKTPRIVNLDDTDATFVDIIHSNPAPNIILGLGINYDLGHSDFWPNGGKQMGCPLTTLRALFNGIPVTEPLLALTTCPHGRSYELFLYSFNQHDCLFVGAECPSYADFLKGKCDCGMQGEKCNFMSIHSMPRPPPRRNYYLKVGDERPYCLHQYQITVYLHTKGDAIRSVSPIVKMTINGKHLIQETLKLNIDLKVQKQVNTFLIFSIKKAEVIQSVKITSPSRAFNRSNVFVDAVKINYIYPK